MAAADVMSMPLTGINEVVEEVSSSFNVGNDLIQTSQIRTRDILSSPTSTFPETIPIHQFVLNTQSFRDLQVYLRLGMNLPGTRELFRAAYPESTFSTHLRNDLNEPPLYTALENTLLDINKHSDDFYTNTIVSINSLAGKIADFATTAASRSQVLRNRLSSLAQGTHDGTANGNVRDFIEEAVDICGELQVDAKNTGKTCHEFQTALAQFEITTNKDKLSLEAINTRLRAVLPTVDQVDHSIREQMVEATEAINRIAKEQNKWRVARRIIEGGPAFRRDLAPLGLDTNIEIATLENWLNLFAHKSSMAARLAEVQLCAAIGLREKTANLTYSIQTVSGAIPKAIEALKHTKNAFSNMETNLGNVASKLQHVQGRLASGSTIRLRRGLILFGEAQSSWFRVVELARRFQDVGLVEDITPEDLGNKESEVWHFVDILSANYGAVDYTDYAKILFNDGKNLRIRSVEPGFPEPWELQAKTISILHQYKKEKRIFVCNEYTGNHKLEVGDIGKSRDNSSICNIIDPYPKPDGAPVQILAIVWGPQEVRKKEVYEYCYERLEKREPIKWCNGKFGGDTWKAEGKSGVIYYTTDDGATVRQCTGRENTETTWKI